LRLSPHCTAGTSGLLYQPQMIGEGDCGAIGGTRIGRETCPSATLSTTNPTWRDTGSNYGLIGGKPATNRLSCGKTTVETVEHVLNVELNSNHRNTALGMFIVYNTEVELGLLWSVSHRPHTEYDAWEVLEKMFIHMNGATSIKFHLTGGNMKSRQVWCTRKWRKHLRSSLSSPLSSHQNFKRLNRDICFLFLASYVLNALPAPMICLKIRRRRTATRALQKARVLLPSLVGPWRGEDDTRLFLPAFIDEHLFITFEAWTSFKPLVSKVRGLPSLEGTSRNFIQRIGLFIILKILWHEAWRPEQWSHRRHPLLSNGSANKFPRQRIRKQ
jgi:hypothetical protein